MFREKETYMRYISRFLKAFVFMMLFCSTVFAQLPDPFDPMYSFENHILKPEKARECHILSCTVFKNGELDKKIVYDPTGHVISDDNGMYTFAYNNSKPHFYHEFNPDFNQQSTVHYYYRNSGEIDRIKKNYKNSNSEEQIDFVYYDEGPLGLYVYQIFMEETNEFRHIKTELAYGEKMELSAFKITTTVYRADSKTMKFVFEEIFSYENGYLDRHETRHTDSDGKITDMNYRYIYDNEGHLCGIRSINQSGIETEIESFTYDDKGLILSRKSQDVEYRYQYETMKTARLNIEITDEIDHLDIEQYWYNNWQRKLGKGPGKWTLDIYLPDLDFYILKLPEDTEYPIQLKPGSIVNIRYSDGKVQKTANDPSNDMIWKIENYKRYISTTMDDKNKIRNKVKLMIDDNMRKNQELPIFLYYSHKYDLRHIQREPDAFDMLAEALGASEENDYYSFMKKYAQSMIKNYPYNSLAIHKYSNRK